MCPSERREKYLITERLCGLRREERGRSGRDEQPLSDILFVHPRPLTPPSGLHYNSFSVRVKVRPDSSASVNGYVCSCVSALTCVLCSVHLKQVGLDGNEESETTQRDL